MGVTISAFPDWSVELFIEVDGCQIPYIPTRLHTGSRVGISNFELGELIYRRLPERIISNPFGISLADISVNRKGLSSEPPLCEREDVLYNTTPEKKPGERIDEAIITLIIKRLTPELVYKFISRPDPKVLPPNAPVHPNRLTQEEIDNTVCVMELIHKPIPCNYSHCAFEIRLNGEEVTMDNYNQTLGLKKYSEVRDKLRIELVEMILTEEIEVGHTGSVE